MALLSPGNCRVLSLDLVDQHSALERSGQFRFTPATHAMLAFRQALREYASSGGLEGRAKRWGGRGSLCLFFNFIFISFVICLCILSWRFWCYYLFFSVELLVVDYFSPLSSFPCVIVVCIWFSSVVCCFILFSFSLSFFLFGDYSIILQFPFLVINCSFSFTLYLLTFTSL